ncbi:hypothetical protein Lfu02_70130 [Longispora fulva]|uniref:Uncharacterized protein n=1 Tax=Longispora fulva TaxID=619741 RepID=A0A8J7GMN5_9ACTN|nr:hypothetical protein [Longispora fulva]MBG6134443.1 hypothetical protein [Longispora fulva]GIG62641.1 hypothetical protein Lfu02_70130 [Longispora fulva]
MGSEPDNEGIQLLAAVVERELTFQDSRKASLENRGNNVITTSGGLVALLFALAALVTQANGYQPPGEAVVIVLLALLLFVAAAVLGLLTNAVRNYARANADQLQRTVEGSWRVLTARGALRMIVDSNLDVLRYAQRQNRGKAQLLRWAILAEVTAVALLAAAVGVILTHALH